MVPETKNHVFRENSAPPVANNHRPPIKRFKRQKSSNPAYWHVNQMFSSRARKNIRSFLTSKSSLGRTNLTLKNVTHEPLGTLL